MNIKQVVIIGAGGHAKVIADIVHKNNDIVIGFLDDNKPIGEKIIGSYEVIGSISDIEKIKKDNIEFIIGIGNNLVRKEIAQKYKIKYYTAIHKSAQIGLDVIIDEGTTVMANSVINPSTRIGKHTIINSGAIIEHDNTVGDYVHIASNATLGGMVQTKDLTHIKNGEIIQIY